ncbi:flavodoxin [Enterobacteriaceae bacterium LUAb1]
MARIGIFVGTVYGNALLVAEEAESLLKTQGHEVQLFEEPTLDNWKLYQDAVILIVTSTTGQGDFPDSIAPLFYDIKASMGYQPTLRYGVIALGDRSYQHFCGAGIQFDALLQAQCAQRIDEILTIDATEEPAPEDVALPWVRHWAKQL